MPEEETTARPRDESRSGIRTFFKWVGGLGSTAIFTLFGNQFFERIEDLENENAAIREKHNKELRDLHDEITFLKAQEAQWGTMAELEHRLRWTEKEVELTQRLFSWATGREIPPPRRAPTFQDPSVQPGPRVEKPSPDEVPPPPQIQPALPPLNADQYRQMQQRKFPRKE